MAKSPAVPKALASAVKGLLFPSETDAPIQAFAWPPGPVNAEAVRSAAGVGPKVRIAPISLAELMRGVPRDMHADFHPLLVAIADNLSGVKVFKVGEMTISVYIVGTLPDGSRAGVTTKVVET